MAEPELGSMADFYAWGASLTEELRAVEISPGSISGREQWENPQTFQAIEPASPPDTSGYPGREYQTSPGTDLVHTGAALAAPTPPRQPGNGSLLPETHVGPDDPIVRRLMAVGAPIEAENRRIQAARLRFQMCLAIGSTLVGGAAGLAGWWMSVRGY